ncbi:hypothetical protein TNCV_2124791 [Trichonephila clavipes]|uniref:HTH psq-type domain-containing protein n=1 Tax=Trichonephila clavipes TaxID=2585209 RepID=A0A8X6R6V7_TRICX|nr:hypothetical protein TNCV_2124791 [Trichonephila clavipes]
MQVIRRLDTGERQSQIGAALTLATSTIRIILKNKEKNTEKEVDLREDGEGSGEFLGGNLVVRASNSRPEGLRSMPDATKYHQSTHESHGKIVDMEIGGVTVYRPFGKFCRANSYCPLYGAQGLGQRQVYF